MKLLAPVLIALLFIGCGDDDSPTAPGDELVGTWVFVSGTGFESEAEGEAFAWVVRRDGTFSLFLGVDGGLSIVIGGVWEIVGGKLITTWETLSASESYTIRGNRLTLVDDEDDAVSVWERH